MSQPLPDIERGLLVFYRTGAPRHETARIRDLQAISDGWENEVYAFTLEDEAAALLTQEPLILRIYPGSDAPRKSAREFEAMRRLHQAGFPVPQVFWLELDLTWFGRPFVIMEKIPGRPIDRVFQAASAAGKQELLSLFCRLLVDLHSLDCESVVSADLLSAGDTAAIMQHELSRLQERSHALGQHDFDPVFDWLSERSTQVRWSQPCLIHGDYHVSNILLREDGSPSVIDWGNIRVSDRRFDLAWTLLLSSTYGTPEVRDLILKEYERVDGCRMEDMDYFEVAACLRRLFHILASLDQGADQLGMRPGAEGMMRDADHLRAVAAVLAQRTGIRIPRIEALAAGVP